jgi:hypothetical protein
VVTTVAGSMSGQRPNDAAEPVYTRGVAGAIEIMQASAHPLATSTFDAEVILSCCQIYHQAFSGSAQVQNRGGLCDLA